MFFKRSDGIGQDEEILRMRRRPVLLAGMILALAATALILVMVLLRNRQGSLRVTADQPGAMVVLNGSLTPLPAGQLIRGLRPDTYDVSLHKPDYRPEPAAQMIRVEAGRTVNLSFTLVPVPPDTAAPAVERAATPQPVAVRETKSAPRTEPPKREASPPLRPERREAPAEPPAEPTPPESLAGALTVTTRPETGGIYVGDEFCGRGTVELRDLPLGELVVRFGDLAGYRAPAPRKVFLSPAQPSAAVEGLYLPLIFISASLDESGRLTTQKTTLSTGFISGDDPPQTDPVVGPEIKYLEEIGTFAWEIGYAHGNRNPPGVDFLEMAFDLPENWDKIKPLELKLYGFASDRRFPFALSGHTGFDMVVNGKPVRQNAAPAHTLGRADRNACDAVAVHSYLRTGTNRIRLQASASSRCFYYLHKIVLM
ncbi:MAG: PEGA domain-containing protein [Candidatus Zixiibacteriota bacterium]|nr:MAG: PEGA domain-containing protein [candidate division Zixibacteria bacterium]